jgi:hypothetical protein
MKKQKIVIDETYAARKQLSVKKSISRQKNERERLLKTRGCLVSETGSGRELKCY